MAALMPFEFSIFDAPQSTLVITLVFLPLLLLELFLHLALTLLGVFHQQPAEVLCQLVASIVATRKHQAKK